MSSDHCVYFRGVDIQQICEKYFAGLYKDVKDSLFTKDIVRNSENKSTILLNKDENLKNKSYIMSFGDGINHICLGNLIYETHGKYKTLDPFRPYNCMYCLRPAGNTYFGIPIAKTCHEATGIVTFHGIDVFCCWECAYAELCMRLTNSLYENSLMYMKELFTRTTGLSSDKLVRASDRRCLQIFNGPQTHEEFHASTTKFSNKPENIIYGSTIYYIAQDMHNAQSKTLKQ